MTSLVRTSQDTGLAEEEEQIRCDNLERITAYAIAGTIMGILLGLLPLILGVKRGKQGLGVAGFFACALCGGLLRALLAAPICGVFTWLIMRKAAPPSPPGQ
jgi:hypothetical protein